MLYRAVLSVRLSTTMVLANLRGLSMEGIISTLLSVFGLEQRSSQAASGKKNEASRLNAEFEVLLGKTAELLRSEHLHLKHRIANIAGDAPELHEGIDTTINNLLTEVEVGMATAQNSRKTIVSGSSFAPLAKWDEVISLLHQQKGAAELQLERSQRCVDQFHRILDDAIGSEL